MRFAIRGKLILVLSLTFSIVVCSSAYGENSNGKIGSASSLSGKCRVLDQWLGQFEKEFPSTGLKHLNSKPGFMPKFANLFRDKYFIPVFGSSYNPAPNDSKDNLLKKVMKQCSGIKKYIKVLQGTFGKGYNRYMWSKQIKNAITIHKTQERWIKDTLATIQTAQPTLKNFETLRNFSSEGENHVFALWPSEQENFNLVRVNLEKKKHQIVQGLGNKTLADVGNMEASLANAHKLKNEVIPQNGEYRDALKDPSITKSWGKTFNNKLNTMISSLVEERTTILKALPDSTNGLQKSIDWQTKFRQDFSQFNEFQQVKAVDSTFAQKREVIFQTIQPEFTAKLKALNVDLNYMPKADELLKSLFSLSTDESLPSYPKYTKVLEAYKEGVLTQLVAGRLKTLSKISPTLTGAFAVLQWKNMFDKDFSTYASYRPVNTGIKEWVMKRAKVLQQAKAEFIESQESLPADKKGLSQSVELLDEIFPTLEDESLPIYREYQQIVLSQIKYLRGRMG